MAKNEKKKVEEVKVEKKVQKAKYVEIKMPFPKNGGMDFVCLKPYWKRLKNWVASQENNIRKHEKIDRLAAE